MQSRHDYPVLATLAALGLFATAYAASARPMIETADMVSTPVSYADLNLSTEAGAKVMLRRITNAARDICGSEPPRKEFDTYHLYGACLKTVTDRAVAKLNSPLVTALNSGDDDKIAVILASAGR
jgi:UrcA family protein